MLPRYILFCVIATIINIAAQYISLAIYDGDYSLYIAMIMGTGTGLVTKFLLDKFYIFSDTSEKASEDIRKFFIYSFMGVFTTLIFWTTEVSFHHLFGFEAAKYVGAVVGLTIGYVLKYYLDKRFVFVNATRSL